VNTGAPFSLSTLAQTRAQQARRGEWLRALRRIGTAPRVEALDAAEIGDAP
jgi:hypothetical protein